MELLITRDDFATHNRKISDSNFNTGILHQHITDAQMVDIQKHLGMEFFDDLLLNSTSTEYQTLLNGGSYEYNGVTYTNRGLKSVLVMYSYARYVLMGSFVDTPFSFVEKTSQDSERVSKSDKKDVYKQNNNTAYMYWQSVELFLNRNSSDYPLWENKCFKKTSFRISKIG